MSDVNAIVQALGQAAQHIQAANTIIGQVAQALPGIVAAAAPAPAAANPFGGAAPADANPFGGQAAANPFGAPAQAAAPTVTPDQIQQLIQPLVANEQIKAALAQEMAAMGIQNLPDAKPEQLGELFNRFKAVEEKARAAGLLGAAAPAAGGMTLV